MGQRGGKTISMNDEISPAYMASKGIKNKEAVSKGQISRKDGKSERQVLLHINT